MTTTLLWMVLTQGAWAANCGDDPALDCDDDGWTQGDGDCNDDEPTVNPSQPEDCEDDLDNDCNNLFNDGCDVDARQGNLSGGGGCTGGAGVGGVSLLFLPFWRRRRGASS